jgi:hypothetical protein
LRMQILSSRVAQSSASSITSIAVGDKARDIYTCPAGKLFTTTGSIVNVEQLLYRASKLDCDGCPFKMRCCPKELARKISRSIHEDARDVARALVGTEAFEQIAVSASASRCCSRT